MSLCRGGQTHQLGEKLGLFLITRNGHVHEPNWELGQKAGMTPGQLERARIHLQDAENADGDPCLGYRVNYRWSASTGSELSLIDEKDTFNRLVDWTRDVMRGARQRFISEMTEQRRIANQFHTVAMAWDKSCRRCSARCRLGRVFDQAADETVRLHGVTASTEARLRAQLAGHGMNGSAVALT